MNHTVIRDANRRGCEITTALIAMKVKGKEKRKLAVAASGFRQVRLAESDSILECSLVQPGHSAISVYDIHFVLDTSMGFPRNQGVSLRTHQEVI